VQEIKPLELDKNPTEMLNGIKGIIYSPSRVRYPMVRLDWLKKHKYSADTRGNNRFIRVTWDEALDLFYRELERVQKEYGPWALHAGQTGWNQTGSFNNCTAHMQRAVGMHGNFITKVGDYSTGAGQTIMPYVLGSTEVYAQGTSWSEILENSENIILWANDPVKNLQVGWNCETHESFKYLAELKEKVAKGEIDKKFIDTYCLGFEEFIQYVQGKTKDKVEKTPEWAAAICGVKADKIREFARMLVSGRTQILMGWCIQRQEHGEQPYWAAAVVAAMVGQIGLPGGGISYGHHYSSIGVPSTGFAGPGGFPRNLDPGMKPKWDNNDFNGYSRTIPVARWIDCLLEPGKEINYNGGKVKLPDFKMMVISGCNPWHHHQDRNRMKKALRKLQTVVTIEFAWTATCRFSDIVLPACTQWERNDIDVYGSYSNKGLIAMHRLVDPLFQSKPDFQIMSELTQRFGRREEYTRGMSEMEWIESLYNDCKKANEGKFEMPEFNEFWEKSVLDFGEGKPWVRHADFRKDPELNPLGTPSGFIEITSRKIGRYGYEHCQEHPMWFEKSERSHGGPGSDKYPFWLQSCHPDKRLHSQMCESEEFRATYAVQGREPVYINPIDAKAKGIKDGDLVRVFNGRGQLLAGAVLTDSYPRGVIRIEEGAWYGPLNEKEGAICTYGDPNTLTQDIGSSELAQATSANTCIVDFEKFTGKVPPVTSFGGPIEVA
ncbi:trimethylamine-N-oxide reductase TorA, partial [Vibrio parahaemolyticus]